MTRSRLLLGVAGVLAGIAVLFVIFGLVFNPILALAAVPFALATYFLWSHATGRLESRVRRRFIESESFDADERTGRSAAGPGRTTSWTTEDGASRSMGRREALAALDLTPGADQRAIRRAYRDRVKAVHPDTDGGDEDEFRRVRAAYERLRGPRRGKG